MSEDEVVAQARFAFREFQREVFAKSPLAQMPDWIATGIVPPAAVLREYGFRSDADNELWVCRAPFVRTWGFSIPCWEAVEALKAIEPLVELGAGSGYWSAILKSAGVDIIATDPNIEKINPEYGFTPNRYVKIENRDGISAVIETARSAFCSWPSKNESWAFQAAKEIRPGHSFAMIALPRGSETATPELYDLLENEFELVKKIIIPQFPRREDIFTIHKRNF